MSERSPPIVKLTEDVMLSKTTLIMGYICPKGLLVDVPLVTSIQQNGKMISVSPGNGFLSADEMPIIFPFPSNPGNVLDDRSIVMVPFRSEPDGPFFVTDFTNLVETQKVLMLFSESEKLTVAPFLTLASP
jgi:hypothetical protein